MKKIIVLRTHGRDDEVYEVTIRLFDTIGDAYIFCEENEDKDTEEYWTHYDVIDEGRPYEIGYKNFPL